MKVKTLPLIFLSCLMNFSVWGQDQIKIDSLKNVLRTLSEDTNKVRCLYLLSNEIFTIKPSEAIVYANQGIALSNKLAYEKGIGNCNSALGGAYLSMGQFDNALKCYESCLLIAEKRNDLMEKALCFDNISIIYIYKGDFEKAIALRLKANEIYLNLREGNSFANGYLWIGNIYMQQGNYPKALNNYLIALRIFEKLNDVQNSGVALVNIGSIIVKSIKT